MKVKVIIIYTVVLSFCIYSQKNTSDINNFSFFSFKFNYSIEDVKKELTRQKKEYKIVKDHYITDESIKFEMIVYKNWHGYDYDESYEDTMNSFEFTFYNKELYSISIGKIFKKEYEKLFEDLNNNFKSIIETEESNAKVIYIDNSIKAIIHPVVFIDKNGFFFLNINVDKKLTREIAKKEDPDKIYYKSTIDELPIRIEPSINGKIIYYISKDDEFSKGPQIKEDEINGIKGNWVQVGICYLVVGWVFDGGFITPANKIASKPVKYITKADNLRLRDTPTQDGKIIRNLKKSEKLELVEKGKEETISGIKGNWVKIKTEKGEVGWCFDGYLGEVK